MHVQNFVNYILEEPIIILTLLFYEFKAYFYFNLEINIFIILQYIFYYIIRFIYINA